MISGIFWFVFWFFFAVCFLALRSTYSRAHLKQYTTFFKLTWAAGTPFGCGQHCLPRDAAITCRHMDGTEEAFSWDILLFVLKGKTPLGCIFNTGFVVCRPHVGSVTPFLVLQLYHAFSVGFSDSLYSCNSLRTRVWTSNYSSWNNNSRFCCEGAQDSLSLLGEHACEHFTHCKLCVRRICTLMRCGEHWRGYSGCIINELNN